MNDSKMEFATALAELGSFGVKGMTECEKYGMAWGCDEDCPVYQRGECQNEYTLKQLGNHDLQSHEKDNVQ